MAEVRLDALRKQYPNGQVAVAGASFTVADGELLVLVGPSGCGKSTLLRMIAGLESINSGTLSIGGRVVNDLEPKDRDIAMVFQSYALYPHMSVAENLGFGLKLRGLPAADVERRVTEAARTLELDALLKRRPGQLSGGQRQRVALGRALVREPSAFLLDEPLSNLDAKLRLSMRVEIARLHRKLKATMIYVTHDQVEAMTLGQRIVVIDRGEIQQIDTPIQLYAKPANLFVAGFLGSPAMNLFRGRIVVESEQATLMMDAGRLPLGPAGALSGLIAASGNADVVIGIRPEDVQRAAPDAAGSFAATLELAEMVGSDTWLNLRIGSHALVVRVGGDEPVQVDASQTFLLRPERLHAFDAASGTRLAC
jgi:multiple sugar transport system ATP-binding protein